MKDFEYSINGTTYRVKCELFVEALKDVKAEDSLFGKDFALCEMAKETFLSAINARLLLDDCRSFHHELYINHQLVWEHWWNRKPVGNFDVGELYEALEQYLIDIGLL